jgi:hypothetical protein
VLPGEHNFVATLIEGRDQKKRPTEFTMNQVLQPFVSEKFNFTKVSPLEVIFRFNETKKGEFPLSHYKRCKFPGSHQKSSSSLSATASTFLTLACHCRHLLGKLQVTEV